MDSVRSIKQFSFEIATLLIVFTINDGDCVFYGHIYPHNIAWTNELILGKGFSVKWTNRDKNWLKMRISAPTNGYISVGFSPTGELTGSDIVMGWMDNKGHPHLKDMYATVGDKVPLMEDRVNNYEFLWGEETDKNTTFIFQRRWKTCDSKYDYQIQEGTVKLIWAYGENDPVISKDESFEAEYNESDFGEFRSVLLKSKGDIPHFPDASKTIKHWNVTLVDAVIENYEKVSYCKIYKAEPTDREHQIIGFRPMIDEKNKQRVYRMTVLECTVADNSSSEDIFEKHLRHSGGYCHSTEIPPEWGQHCTNTLFSWAIGSEGLMLPKNVGIPLNEEYGGATYFMLEIHYDNPKLLKIEDSSGVRIYLTDDIRDIDGGTISISTSKIGQFQFLPPKTPKFTNMAFCTSECTAQTLPPDGITLTHVNFHVHSTTQKMILRHIRDGKELSPIAQESYYDPNYQQIQLVNPARKIFPGDEIIIECDYNTMEQDNVTYGGINVRDEMCLANIHYHPRTNLSLCRNHYEFNNFFSSLGIKKVVRDDAFQIPNLPYIPRLTQIYDPKDDAYIVNPSNGVLKYSFDLIDVIESDFYENITVREYLTRFRWNDNNNEKVNQIAKQLWHGKHYAFCTGHGLKRIPLEEYSVSHPNFVPYVQPVSYECPLEISGSTKLSMGMLQLIIWNIYLYLIRENI